MPTCLHAYIPTYLHTYLVCVESLLGIRVSSSPCSYRLSAGSHHQEHAYLPSESPSLLTWSSIIHPLWLVTCALTRPPFAKVLLCLSLVLSSPPPGRLCPIHNDTLSTYHTTASSFSSYTFIFSHPMPLLNLFASHVAHRLHSHISSHRSLR